ncbi:hypothetical protein PTKIN_Ptkin11bG0145100 [Pterospermum kingtungense]
MTGGSLGLRTGSYGSLQNTNGVIAGGGGLLHSKSIIIRNNSTKMLSASGKRRGMDPYVNGTPRNLESSRIIGRRDKQKDEHYSVANNLKGACPVCYLPVDQAIASMPSSSSVSPVLRNLTYVHDKSPIKSEPHGGSDFGGYPSLKQRNESFDIKESMTVHCGFVKGSKPGHQTGFDFDESNLEVLQRFHDIVVASAIFENYDIIQQPRNISEEAKKNIPFYMFIDEETEAYMKNKSILDSSKMVGLWRIVVIRNVPYSDARRNGKVPKLLLHRIFPNVCYSIWIDGKLQLVVDPYQLLERWTTSLSYNGTSKFKIYVPEGCVLIKEHIPITNLFTCLWFNEVDRFTSRDQLSFAIVRDKIMAKVDWSINMFLDCERRNFVIQAYHRELLEQMPPPVAAVAQLPPVLPNINIRGKPPGKRIPRHGRDRRSGSRRHRKAAAGNRDGNSF